MWTKFDTELCNPIDGCYYRAIVSNWHAKKYDQEMNDNLEDTVKKVYDKLTIP